MSIDDTSSMNTTTEPDGGAPRRGAPRSAERKGEHLRTVAFGRRSLAIYLDYGGTEFKPSLNVYNSYDSKETGEIVWRYTASLRAQSARLLAQVLLDAADIVDAAGARTGTSGASSAAPAPSATPAPSTTPRAAPRREDGEIRRGSPPASWVAMQTTGTGTGTAKAEK